MPYSASRRPGSLARLDHPTRLAVEMALHEEHERRALEGALSLLEQAWTGAEEVAAISDNLLLPEGTESRLEKMLRGEGDGAPRSWPALLACGPGVTEPGHVPRTAAVRRRAPESGAAARGHELRAERP